MKANGKDAYYFPHDAGARHDPRTAALIKDYGVWGYGAYWIVIETLREQPGYFLEDAEYVRSAIAQQLQSEIGAAVNFLEDCVKKYALLTIEDGKIYSPSLSRRMAAVDARREINRENAKKSHTPKKEKATAKRSPSDRRPIAERSTFLLYTNLSFEIPDNLKSIAGFADAWNAFVAHRVELKKPMTERSARITMNQLAKMSDPVLSIETSVMSGWTGVFDRTENSKTGRGAKRPDIAPRNLMDGRA
jgi:hypothetical protein